MIDEPLDPVDPDDIPEIVKHDYGLPRTRAGWRALLEELDVRPSKGLGQNFLFERGVVDRIVRLAGVSRDDHILEIGPGLGILTESLMGYAGEVTVVEYDRRLAGHLRATFGPHEGFRLIEVDALNISTAELFPDGEPFSVVANLPYNIASGVIRHLLDQPHRPRRLVLMVQREVAERIVASPGDLSVLGVATQFYADARILFDVAPTVFVPPPTVTSSVLRLDVKPELPLPEDQIDAFMRIVRAGFGQKRKQVANSIAARFGLPKAEVEGWLRRAGIDPDRRAQTLTIDEWVAVRRAAPSLPKQDTSQTSRRDRSRAVPVED